MYIKTPTIIQKTYQNFTLFSNLKRLFDNCWFLCHFDLKYFCMSADICDWQQPNRQPHPYPPTSYDGSYGSKRRYFYKCGKESPSSNVSCCRLPRSFSRRNSILFNCPFKRLYKNISIPIKPLILSFVKNSLVVY